MKQDADLQTVNKAKITRLLKKHSVILLLIFSTYVLVYLLNVSLAQLLGAEQYGAVSLLLRLLGFCVPLIALGTGNTIILLAPEYIDTNQIDRLHGYFRWNFKLFFSMSLGFVVISTLITGLCYAFLKLDPISLYKLKLMFYGDFVAPPFAYLFLQDSLLRAEKRYYVSAILSWGGFAMFTIAVCFAIQWLFGEFDAFMALLAMSISCVVVIVVQLPLLLSSLPKNITQTKPVYATKKWFKDALQMVTVDLLAAGITFVSILLFEVFDPNRNDVAHYAVCIVIAASLMTINIGTSVLISPWVKEDLDAHKKRNLQRLVNVTNHMKVVLVVVMMLIIIFFGEKLLGSFGKDYQVFYPSLVIFSIGNAIIVFLGTSVPLLLYSNNRRTIELVRLIELILVVVLGALLIPFYHLIGAAVGLSAGGVIAKLYNAYMVRKKLDMRTFYII